MTKSDIDALLVVGIDTVSITNSAREAGYRTYAADYFGDVDLRLICCGCEAIIEQKRGQSCGRMGSRLKPQAFLQRTESLLQKYEIDAILLSSGLDDSFDILYALEDLVPILGNCPKVIERVREKPGFFEALKCLGITHPETTIVKSIEEVIAAAIKIEYPVVVKPVGGFGGAGVRIAQNSMEIERAFWDASSVNKDLLVQKFIDGIHVSVSFLAANKHVKVLTVNEQLLGLGFLFQQEPFGYCGNIVPLSFNDSIMDKCRLIAEKISLHFGLKGSNGIDFVISKEGTPYVVEVNPRFQGTLRCVEKVLGINLVKSHVDACLHNFLPTIREKVATFCTRLILHAPERVIAPDLTVFPEVRNIPLPGIIIEKGEPLCSLMTQAENQTLSFQKAKKIAKSIYSILHPA